MSYFFAAYFFAFFGICIKSFGAFGQPGVSIDASNGFLWFDLAILMTDSVCLVWIMNFLRRYANDQNYSKIIRYTKDSLDKVLFVVL